MRFRRVRWAAVAGFVLAALPLLLAGCASSTDGELFRHALALSQQGRWAEAEHFARAYVLKYPDEPGAHYLWGRCHAHPDPQFALAMGEFRTANQLLLRKGELGLIGTAMTPSEFEAAIYQEMALLHMRWASYALELEVPGALVRSRLSEALENARKGLALTPESSYLAEMVEELEGMLELPERRRRPFRSERRGIRV